MECKECGSFAINDGKMGREFGVDLHLCDVHYWQKRAAQQQWVKLEKDNEPKEKVLIKSHYGIHESTWHGNDVFRIRIGNFYQDVSANYWQPLPAPPSE